jgi:hypothetical protein
MLYQRYEIEKGASIQVDLTQLMSLRYNGDLEGYLDAYDDVLLTLSKKPDEDWLLGLIETELRKVASLGPQFVIYDASPHDPNIQSAQWLYDRARVVVSQQRRMKNRESLLDQSRLSFAAPAPRGPGNNNNSEPQGQSVIGDNNVEPKRVPQGKYKTPPERDLPPPPPLPPPILITDAQPEKDDAPPCVFYKEGRCLFGSECKFRHEGAGGCVDG